MGDRRKRTLKRRISGWTRERGWPLTLMRPLPCCKIEKSLSMPYIPKDITRIIPSLRRMGVPNSTSPVTNFNIHHSLSIIFDLDLSMSLIATFSSERCVLRDIPIDAMIVERVVCVISYQGFVFIPCSGRQRWLFQSRIISKTFSPHQNLARLSRGLTRLLLAEALHTRGGRSHGG